MDRRTSWVARISALIASCCLTVHLSAAPPTPLASWLFDESMGLIAHPQVGGIDGNLTGPNSPNTSGPVFVTDSPLTYPGNHSLNFDGVDDDVNMGVNPVLDLSGGLTITAWIKARTLKLGNVVSNAAGGISPSKFYSLLMYEDGRLEGTIFDGGGFNVATAVTAIPVVSTNSWTHMAYTYDGLKGRLFVNGVLQATSSDFVGPAPHSGLVDFEVGSRLNSNFFDGRIDEVGVWTNALSQSDVLFLVDQGLNPVPEPSTVALASAALLCWYRRNRQKSSGW